MRAQFGLPPSSDTDIMCLPSTTLNKADDPNSGYMTIGQLIVKNLMDKYRGMLERGEMAKDDPRAKLVRAFEARSALANGYSLLPYYESPGAFGSTYRTYPGGEDDPTFPTMSPADVAALIDPVARWTRKSANCSANPAMQADYQAALNDSVDSLPNKQAVLDTLYDTVTKRPTPDALQALKAAG